MIVLGNLRSFLAPLLAVLLAVLLAGGLALGPAAPAAHAKPAKAVTSYEKQARKATNHERTERDLEALKKKSCVQKWARKQARKMAKQDRMFHQDLGPVMRACDLRGVGENVAAGFTSGTAVVEAWMRSKGHRENILRPQFRLLGMAARQASDGTWYACQVFGTR